MLLRIGKIFFGHLAGLEIKVVKKKSYLFRVRRASFLHMVCQAGCPLGNVPIDISSDKTEKVIEPQAGKGAKDLAFALFRGLSFVFYVIFEPIGDKQLFSDEHVVLLVGESTFYTIPRKKQE